MSAGEVSSHEVSIPKIIVLIVFIRLSVAKIVIKYDVMSFYVIKVLFITYYFLFLLAESKIHCLSEN